jgi:glycosyltransferase involved in cell wall biosynthesis
LVVNPEVSAIIPVKNGGAVFEECLVALRASHGVAYEIIVLNDASTDNTAEIAEKFSCRLVELPSSLGPANARNRGAEIAKGGILFFIDADIIVRPDTMQKITTIFRDRGIVAVTGVLAEHIRYSNFSSHYKNLWMRYSYLEMPDKVSLFYTSAAAIRKEIFFKTGGFDTGYKSPSVEDTDFGQRLEMRGNTVHLQRDLEVEHAKHYSFWGLLKTDFYRSAAMVKMTLRQGLGRFLMGGNKTSVRTSFILGVLLYCLAWLTALAGIVFPTSMVICFLLSGIFIFSIYLLNATFLKWLVVRKGWWFFMQSLFLILLDVSVVIMGIFFGVFDYLRGHKY